MRFFTALTVTILLAPSFFCQLPLPGPIHDLKDTKPANLSSAYDDATRIERVRILINGGLEESPRVAFHLLAMGDSAASAVIEYVGIRALSEKEINNILAIIRKSFERPTAITPATNRVPNASLVLLQNLEAAAQTPQQREEVVALRDLLRKFPAAK